MSEETKPDLTFFICGPVKNCEHDYSGWEDMVDAEGRNAGGTSVCVKCGAKAFFEDMWR